MKWITCILLLLSFGLNAQKVYQSIAHLKTDKTLGRYESFSVLGAYFPGDGGSFNGYVDEGTADEIGSFALQSGRIGKRIIAGNSISLKALGVKTDSVSTSDQALNYSRLKYAIENYDNVIFEDTVQIYLSKTPISLNRSITFAGQGKDNTLLEVFPRFKGYWGDRTLFVHNGGSLGCGDMTFKSYPYRWDYETYKVTFRPSGDADAIQIYENQRIGFWSSISIGDTMIYQVDSATIGNYIIVSAIDSANAKISFTGNFGTSDDFTNDSSFVAKPWTTELELDTINQYSRTWNTISRDSSSQTVIVDELIFIKSQSVDEANTFNFNNCDIIGFDRTFSFVATNTLLELKETTVQGNSIGISWTGASVNQYARVYINGGFIQDCATLCVASINPNGPISTNAPFGGGVYAHPGIVPSLNNVVFQDNNSTSFRNFSSSGNDIALKGWAAYFVNCTWYESNFEPYLILSKSFPSQISNCRIYAPSDGGQSVCYIGNSTVIRDSYLNVPFVCNLNSEPSDCDTCRYQITIDNCQMYENCRWNFTEWPDMTHTKTNIQILNSTIYPGTRNAGFCFKVGAGQVDVINLKVKNRLNNNDSVLNNLFVIDSVGNTSNPIIGDSIRMNLDNIVYDSTLNHTFIVSAYDTLSTNYKVFLKNSIIRADTTDGTVVIQ